MRRPKLAIASGNSQLLCCYPPIHPQSQGHRRTVHRDCSDIQAGKKIMRARHLYLLEKIFTQYDLNPPP